MSLPNPVVLLDARARYLHPAFVCSRPSAKMCWQPDGIRRAVQPDALPWDADPASGEWRGLRVETPRINLCPRSLEMETWSVQGDAVVTDSGLPGTVEGATWRRLEKTTDAAGSTTTRPPSILVEAGNYYCFSMDVLPDEARFFMIYLTSEFTDPGFGGTSARAVFNLDTGEAAVVFGADAGAFQVWSTPLRDGGYRVAMMARAYQSGSIRPLYLLCDGMDPAVTNTLPAGAGAFISAHQAEVSDYRPAARLHPSSFMVTEASSALRASDTIFMPTPVAHPWFSPVQGTFVVEAFSEGARDGTQKPVVSLSQGDASGIALRNPDGGGGWSISSNMWSLSIGQAGPQEWARICFSYDAGRRLVLGAVNGGPAQQMDDLDFDLTLVEALNLGRHALGGNSRTSTRFDGLIKRVYFYPATVTPALAQALSAIQE